MTDYLEPFRNDTKQSRHAYRELKRAYALALAYHAEQFPAPAGFESGELLTTFVKYWLEAIEGIRVNHGLPLFNPEKGKHGLWVKPKRKKKEARA